MRIFIIEDNPIYSEILSETLGEENVNQVDVFSNGDDALAQLSAYPDIITLDYFLPGQDGRTILKKIKEKSPNSNVIIVSGQDNIATAINLLKEGAYDYIVKDNETTERILSVYSKIKDKILLERKLESLQNEVSNKYKFNDILKGQSKALEHVFSLMSKAVETNINVSITGETGTGKELVARSIHFNSKRSKKDFIAVNVAAIPSDLIESELFGHEKGAFTGANHTRIGKFEEANGGTIFLDEIGEMDINMQAKLLRVLQEKEVIRIGANKPIKIDVRILTATHRDLEKEIEEGNFREDLYFRLMGLPIHLPPLRERGNDILFLAKYFINVFCKENDLKEKSISQAAQSMLLSYAFPGNVRELKAMIDLAVVLSDGDEIKEKDLKFYSRDNELGFLEEETTLRDYTAQIVQHFLEKYDYNVMKVARKLDVGKSTLYRMIKNGDVNLKR